MTDPAEGFPPGPGRHARAGGGQRPFLARNRWYGVLLAGVPAAAVAIGVILLTNGPDGHPASTDCGLVRCSAALPKSTSAVPQGKVTVEPTSPHRHAAAAPARAPSPAPAATTAPAAPSPSASPGPPASHRAHGHGHAGGHHGHGH